MKHTAIYIFIIALLLAAGCSLPAALSDVNDPKDSASEPANIPSPTPAPTFRVPDIDTPFIHPLSYCETMDSNSEIVKSMELEGGIVIENRYDGNAGQSFISINGIEEIVCDWECYVRLGLYDINHDDQKEVIFFLSPMMSNTGWGNIYIFDLSDGVKEVFAFAGDGDYASSGPPQPHAYFEMPDGLPYTVHSDYREFCQGLNILNDRGTYFLQIVHNMTSDKVAYSYLVWNEKWEVIEQEVTIP